MTSEKVRTTLILAGGFGKRLRTAVPNLPKPLAPVINKPFLFHLLDRLVEQGARDFILLLHYQSELIKTSILKYIDNSKASDLSIRFAVEPRPFGTGGAIKYALDLFNIESSFLVVNGDTWLNEGLVKMSSSMVNSLAAVKIKDSSRYGTFEILGDEIVSFIEKNKNFDGHINAGMYHLDPIIFQDFRSNEYFSLESDVFPLLAEQRKLKCVKLKTDFIDIGIPDDYQRFCSWSEQGRINEI